MIQFKFTQYKPINVVVRTATPVDEFHFDTIVPAHVGSECTIVSNPLYVIFNSERLSQLGDYSLKEWIESMNQSNSDPLKELRKNVSDDDLINLMKSRYCQQPCEIAQWSAYLQGKIDTLTKEAQELAAAQSLETQSDNMVSPTDTNIVKPQSE